jgi:hypothetical protein
MLGGGREERGLVDAQRPHRAHPGRVVDERGAVAHDGVHHGPPADPELSGDDRDRHCEFAHLTGGLSPRPQGEHRPVGHVLDRFGPGLLGAVGVHTGPPTLQHDEAGRAPEARQVSDLTREPILGLGPHATTPTALDVGRRLDGDHHLGSALVDLKHPKAVQSQQGLGQTDSVAHRQGVLLRRRGGTQQRWRDP